jgi:hypothetical protein
LSDRRRVGALWEKVDRNGKKMFFGEIEIDGQKLSIIAFENVFKKKPTDRDFRIQRGRKSGMIPSPRR